MKTISVIYLTGFMGSGKNTVGERLAVRLGLPFIDVDRTIEERHHLTIAEIFDTQGEAAFRRIETDAIGALGDLREGVIALGGGAFVQPQNLELIQNHGISIWLDCPLHLILKRVGKAVDRPLARDPEKLTYLYEQRRAGYARADLRVEILGDDPDETADRILLLLPQETKTMQISRRDLALLLPALAVEGSAQAQAPEAPVPSTAAKFEDLPVKVSGANKSRQVINGTTHSGYHVDMHMTELPPGAAPHPPHHHVHEEMIMIHEGTLEVTISGKATKLGPGSTAYVASNQEHGWKNVGTTKAQYFVLALGRDKV